MIKTCAIFHNMIVEDRYGSLTVEDAVDDLVGLGVNFALFGCPQVSALEASSDDVNLFAARVGAFDAAMQSCYEHALLQDDLVKHINQ